MIHMYIIYIYNIYIYIHMIYIYIYDIYIYIYIYTYIYIYCFCTGSQKRVSTPRPATEFSSSSAFILQNLAQCVHHMLYGSYGHTGHESVCFGERSVRAQPADGCKNP